VQSPSVPFDSPSKALLEDFFGLSGDRLPAADAQVEIEVDKMGKRCPAPFQRMTIRSNGDALPCCHFRGAELVMGNVFRDGVRTVWRNEKLNLLREQQKAGRYAENDSCRRCFENAVNIAPDPGSVRRK
jgi:radical SAM protein with 4Fe4S-binding SPASM domain